MKYTVNLLDAADHPAEWAKQREDEGWDTLAVADHLFTGTHLYPHVWVSAATIAAATTRPTVSTAFVNNLFRSPVEVAQAALQMQQVSNGRFELGLGAGWAAGEITATGATYPDAPVRAGRFIEAIQIVRALVHAGSCSFHGEHYDIEVAEIGPHVATPPKLAASVGGPRTTRGVTPHVDRVELKAQSAATRGGALDLAVMGSISDEHLLQLIERVRAVRPDIEIGMFVLCGVGDDSTTKHLRAAMDADGRPGLFSRFFGPPGEVVDGLGWLESIGISQASLNPMTPASLERLAPHVH